jgi:hypothetical protein
MVSPRSYFARMNENRGDNNWLTENQLLEGSKEFFRSNDYYRIEHNKTFDQGGRTFSSPIVATKIITNNEGQKKVEMITTIFRSKIKHYDLGFFGFIESITLDLLDNYEQTNLMLVTDSCLISQLLKTKKLVLQLKI